MLELESTKRYEHGVRFVVLLSPEIIGFDDFSAYPYGDLHTMVRQSLPGSVEVVDPLDDVKALGVPPRELWVAPTDCHKNAAANAAMAGALAKHLLAGR